MGKGLLWLAILFVVVTVIVVLAYIAIMFFKKDSQ